MEAFDRRIADGFLYGDFQYDIDAGSDTFMRRGVVSCYQPVGDGTQPVEPVWAIPGETVATAPVITAGRLGPLSHIYVRINRPTPPRYPAWDCPWMLDPAEAGGGCLRNLGPHGLDMFLHLTGEPAQVTGASRRTRPDGFPHPPSPGGGSETAPPGGP